MKLSISVKAQTIHRHMGEILDERARFRSDYGFHSIRPTAGIPFTSYGRIRWPHRIEEDLNGRV